MLGGLQYQDAPLKNLPSSLIGDIGGWDHRRADPQYDLFAVAMIMLNAVYPTRFSKKGEGYSQLKEKIIQKQALKPYRKMLENALQGKYDSAEDMRKDLITILSNPKNSDDFPKTSSDKQSRVPRQTRSVHRKTRVKHKKKGRFVETFVLVAVISFLYVLYIYDQLL